MLGEVWWLVGRVSMQIKRIGRYLPVVVVGRGSEAATWHYVYGMKEAA